MTEQAQQRLLKALDRLEAASRTLTRRAAAGTTKEPAAGRLRAEYRKLREDYAALERATATASARVDAVIARLKGALEG